MRVTVIPMMISAFETIPRGLERGGWKSKEEPRQSRLQPEYWEESKRFEETCCNSDSIERLSANTGVKNSQGVM